MPKPSPKYIERYIDFHPPEADRLADAIKAVFVQLGNDYTLINRDIEKLNANWEGIQKMLFFTEAIVQQNELKKYLDYLHQQERVYRTIMVKKKELVPLRGEFPWNPTH